MTDDELKAWAGAWQSNVPDTEPLRRRTRHELGWLRFIVASDVVACLACLALAVWWLFFDTSRLREIVAISFVAIGVIGLVFTAQNWRGVWQANGETAHDFLALARVRVAARMRWLRFGAWLLAAQTVFFAGVMIWRWLAGVEAARILQTAGLLIVLFALVGAWLLRLWRRERRNRLSLDHLAAQLDLED